MILVLLLVISNKWLGEYFGFHVWPVTTLTRLLRAQWLDVPCLHPSVVLGLVSVVDQIRYCYRFELLESEKENYLDSSGNSLEHAIKLYEVDSSSEPDERWLQYYILGKIAEKKRKEPAEYLQYYVTVSFVYQCFINRPGDRINGSNKWRLRTSKAVRASIFNGIHESA